MAIDCRPACRLTRAELPGLASPKARIAASPGGAGADALNGGDGSDLAGCEGSAAAVTVNLQAGTAPGGDAQDDTLTTIGTSPAPTTMTA